jgi:NET1-associated nuclear protein 1 (U3 small nucleolar RNA-associated protein 17)
MILSTTELVPTANIAGIQAHVAGAFSHSKPRVWRLEDENNGRPLIPRTPAVINPAHPSRLLLAVGEIQEVNPRSKSVLSAPYLQTYDIASNHNLTRQALTRTNVNNKNIAPNAHSISEPVISHMQISHDGSWLATVDEFIPPRRDIDFLAHSGMDLDIEQRRRREVYLKFWQWSKADETWALVTRIDAPHMMAVEQYGAGRVLALSVDSSSLTFSTLGEDGIVQIWRPRVRKRDGVVVRGKDGEALCTWSCHRRVSLGTPEIEDNTQSFIPSHGSLAFSEDGSILAAAIDGMDKGLVHLINPFTGMIRASQPAVYSGDLISMAFISQYIITLSDELQVYDLVLNERKYGITLGYIKTLLDANQKKEMFHLSVDQKSKTFAIAIPCREDWNPQERKQIGTLQMAYSEIAVFDPKYPVPIYTKRSSSLATALLPAISSPGFVVLDAAAEITTISPKATQTLTSLARPMVELRLDIAAEEEPAIDLMQLADETEEMDAVDEEEISPAADVAPIDPDDDGPPVISQQRLTEVLDIGPSFALPPVEQMFYHVADLFSSKPVAQAAS